LKLRQIVTTNTDFHFTMATTIHQTYNDWENLIPFIDKAANDSKQGEAIFRNYFDEITVENKPGNKWIIINAAKHSSAFFCLSLKNLLGCRLNKNVCCIPLYLYNEGEKTDNITGWALSLFQEKYQLNESSSPVCYLNSSEVSEEFRMTDDSFKTVTKEAIFHYIYAVLHNPDYREKYGVFLKADFPRIPLYCNFWQWANWGEQLMSLHMNFEMAKPYELQRNEILSKENPKVKLTALKDMGVILLDENTELRGIPTVAWEYKVGDLSALELVLQQYNIDKFSDQKETLIELLKKVCTVSLETMKVVEEMKGIKN